MWYYYCAAFLILPLANQRHYLFAPHLWLLTQTTLEISHQNSLVCSDDLPIFSKRFAVALAKPSAEDACEKFYLTNNLEFTYCPDAAEYNYPYIEPTAAISLRLALNRFTKPLG